MMLGEWDEWRRIWMRFALWVACVSAVAGNVLLVMWLGWWAITVVCVGTVLAIGFKSYSRVTAETPGATDGSYGSGSSD